MFCLSKTIQNTEGSIAALAFSNDHRYLGSVSADGSIRIYDVDVHFQTIWFHRRSSQFNIINWDNDCSLIMGTTQGEVFIFSLNSTKKLELVYVSESSLPINSIEFNKDRDKMLVTSGGELVVMGKENNHWTFQRHIQCPIPREAQAILSLQYLPVVVGSAHFLEDQQHSVVVSRHHGLWKLNLESGRNPWKKMITSVEREEMSAFSLSLPIKFIYQGRAIVMGTANGYAEIMNIEHGGSSQILRHSTSNILISGLAYHEDALLIATGDENGKICVWTSGCSPLDCSKIRFLKELLLLVGSNTIIELLRVLLTLILLVTMFKVLPSKFQHTILRFVTSSMQARVEESDEASPLFTSCLPWWQLSHWTLFDNTSSG
ncbi:WD40-repeat-containing domain protein [Lentinula edodes]|uniref:WD40-repeat-containing domain protein n=1 Tax=Lentinula edodes TaxID=5353 RepID=UPI001E8E2031|nr:WD40-repeat-containing domain protein [Lentinula edodes]KAH7872433.1 WD40-repeat-containing domain protein [Lentinula edodes]